MQCRLCAYDFEVQALSCHAGCPFGAGCHLICCPNCGYQVVDDSKSSVAKLLDRLFRRRPRGLRDRERSRRVLEERLVPLSHVAAGRDAVVRLMDAPDESRASRLTVFGLAPGASVSVVQRLPAPVILVGETELALGREVLDHIWVQADEDALVPDED